MTTNPLPAIEAYAGENEVTAAIAAGMALAEPVQVADGLAAVVVPSGGELFKVDLNAHLDKYAYFPRRKTGTVHVQDSESFVAYVAKHGLAESEVFADPARRALVGVINAHSAADQENNSEAVAGHGDHRVALELIHSPEWKVWLAKDKQWMDQQAFAEHLEDNAADITVPDAATMLEIAQTFHASTDSEFKSASRLHSGEVTLNYVETIGASAGQKGEMEIPTEFTITLAPYAGQSDRCDMTARFRYRIRQGTLTLSYALVRPEDHARDVFTAIVDDVRGGITQPVFVGRPE